jgi:hypothetical protein
MADERNRWIARIKPPAGGTIDDLLRMPFSLDVWERRENALVVAAYEWQLFELERRRIAEVERLSTVSEYLQAARQRDESREQE